MPANGSPTGLSSPIAMPEAGVAHFISLAAPCCKSAPGPMILGSRLVTKRVLGESN
jgi:hypothetical protein